MILASDAVRFTFKEERRITHANDRRKEGRKGDVKKDVKRTSGGTSRRDARKAGFAGQIQFVRRGTGAA